MNYNGNMPDWHQYNAPQTNEIPAAVENVNSGHLTYIPGVSPSSVNAINLSSEGLDKHQSEASYSQRHYQTLNNVAGGPTISNNNPLTSMVQMQNCIGHYGSSSTRNHMLENLNAPIDPRNASIGTINDDLAYRSNQVPFNGPITHLNGPNCNMNPPPGPGPGSRPGLGTGALPGPGPGPGPGTGPGHGHGPSHGPAVGTGNVSMGPRNANVEPVPSGRSGPPPFIPCKSLCCNPDPNISYQQWEKYGSYQANTAYRDNVRPQGYQTDNRRFGNNFNFRKDAYDGKESMGAMVPGTANMDHRRGFGEYKYHKDPVMSRNYPASTGVLHNYPVQNYNYAGDYQKCPYPMKEHQKMNNMNVSNPGVYKHQEQNYMAQPKYNNKQMQYQNGGNMVAKGMPTMNATPNVMMPQQNSYFNSQYQRNIPAEMPHECQETTENTTVVNRMPSTYMHATHSRYQLYQQKIAMQKFSMENHLRELSKIPGYQSHPKYKEYVHRYGELVKLSQSTGYQNQIQQAPRAPTPVNTAQVPPISLQFDQNGMLVNSTYLPDNFPRVQQPSSAEQRPENAEGQNKNPQIPTMDGKQLEAQQMIIQAQPEQVACTENAKQNQYQLQKDYNQNQLKVQPSNEFEAGLNVATSSNETIIQKKVSKEFANKPDLDVRQFLANWDETDEEEGTISNLPDVILNNATPVVVVSYENVDLTGKVPQNAQISAQDGFVQAETMQRDKKDEGNVISAQDCLTISYCPTDDPGTAKTQETSTTEGIVKPGSIIHCISNGPDDIPTIHIVDNLEISNILPSEQVIGTLDNQKTMYFESDKTSSPNEPANSANSDTNELAANCTESPGENEASGANSSPSSEEISPVRIGNDDLDGLSEKSNLARENLKKQNSFTSEESHNPDDISLPDLPTSECTPISTTLNTPIHSYSEESSSEQMEDDLTISTNPIEIMQNSPVISFTQSPVKLEPYKELNSMKNGTFNSLGLEFQESSGEQEVALGNFHFPDPGHEFEENSDRSPKNSGKSDSAKNLAETKKSDGHGGNKVQVSDSEPKIFDGQKELYVASQKEEIVRQRKSSVAENCNASTERDSDKRKLSKEKLMASVKREIQKKNKPEYSRRSLNSDSDKTMKIPTVSHTDQFFLCHRTSSGKDRRKTSEGSKSRERRSDLRETSSKTSKTSGKHSRDIRHIYKKHILQKDLRTVDGDVKYSKEEIRMLKEYRRRRHKLNLDNETRGEKVKQTEILSREEGERVQEQGTNDDSAVCQKKNKVEYSSKPLAQPKSHAAETTVLEEENHVYSKHFVNNSNTDYGIQVTNVNLKIKDKETRNKALNLADRSQDRIKDALEGFKIEINVSCTDRNGRKPGSNRVCENTRVCSKFRDCQCHLYTKEEAESSPGSVVAERKRKSDGSVDEDVVAQRKMDAKLVDVPSSIVPKEPTNSLDRQLTNRSCTNVALKDLSDDFRPSALDDRSEEAKEGTSYDQADKMKQCAILNTASELLGSKTKGLLRITGPETPKDSEPGLKAKLNKHLVSEMLKVSKTNERELSGISHLLKSVKRPLDDDFLKLNTKPLALGAMNFDFERLNYENSSAIGFDRVRLSGNETSEFDGCPDKWKGPKIGREFDDSSMFESSSGYINPLFSNIDKLENLHTVPVYTTKDGKISYSPNRRFTYHQLLLEAREREGYFSPRRSYYPDYYNYPKCRKLHKRRRNSSASEKRRLFEPKDTKLVRERKKSYTDDLREKEESYKEYAEFVRNCGADSIEENVKTFIETCDSTGNNVDENVTIDSERITESEPVDVEEKNPECSDVVEKNPVCSDVPEKNPECEDVPEKNPECSDVPEQNPECGDVPDKNPECRDVPEKQIGTDVTLTDSNTQNELSESEKKLHPGEEISSRTSENELDSISNVQNASVTEEVEAIESVNAPGSNAEVIDSENTSPVLNNSGEVVLDEVFPREEPTIVETDKTSGDCSCNETKFEESKGEEKDNGETLEKQSDLLEEDSANTDMVNLEEIQQDLQVTRFEAEREIVGSGLDSISDELEEVAKPLDEPFIFETLDITSTSLETEINPEIQHGENVPEFDVSEICLESLTNVRTENLEETNSSANKDIAEEFIKFDEDNNKFEEVLNQKTDTAVLETVNNQESSVYKEHAGSFEDPREDTPEPECLNSTKDENDLAEDKKDETRSPTKEETKENRFGHISIECSVPLDLLQTDLSKSYFESQTTSEDELSDDFSNEKAVLPLTNIYQDRVRVNSTQIVRVKDDRNRSDEDDDEEDEEEDRSYSSSLETPTYSYLSDSETKMIPKLVIKKTEPAGGFRSNGASTGTEPSKSRGYVSTMRPKLPRMIIKSSRSRSGSPYDREFGPPSIEKSEAQNTSNSEPIETCANQTEPFEPPVLTIGNFERPIPRMRIKLEDKPATEKATLDLDGKKSVPKVTIRRVKLEEGPTNEPKEERLPRLKLKKQEEERFSSSERAKKKQSVTVGSKTNKRVKREEEDGQREQSSTSTDKSDSEGKRSVSKSEKVPKVIIKRSLIGSEFKCEISNSERISMIRNAKWQPKVKLERSRDLDRLVKNLKEFKSNLSTYLGSNGETITPGQKTEPDVKLARSSSTSNLSPMKQKQRRLSDYDYVEKMAEAGNLCNSDSEESVKSMERTVNSNDYRARTRIGRCCDKENDYAGANRGIRNGRKRISGKSSGEVSSEEDSSDLELRSVFSYEIPGTKSKRARKRTYLDSDDESEYADGDKTIRKLGVSHSNSFDENDDSVIKLDSSDESETTIEILPASPDSSPEMEIVSNSFEGKTKDMVDAIPTQLELELEVIDNKNMKSGEMLSDESGAGKESHVSQTRNGSLTEEPVRRYSNEFEYSSYRYQRQGRNNDKLGFRSTRSANEPKEAECKHTWSGESDRKDREEMFEERKDQEYFYDNDSLVKEVMAAKETLRKCLAKPDRSVKNKPRPKTAQVERRNSSSEAGWSSEKETRGNKKQKTEEDRSSSRSERNQTVARKRIRLAENAQEESLSTISSVATAYGSFDVDNSRTISLKATKQLVRKMNKEVKEVTNERSDNNKAEVRSGLKENADSDRNGAKETKGKEDMPVLVPEANMNFDPASDRDSSRSPPIITSQDIANSRATKVTGCNKVNTVQVEKKQSQREPEISIADVVMQLAYHEKATIKDRRYCNLCERWFPTTSRHRRHLAGYQHRHIELTQRKSIHALFVLFTGKPCPKLAPASIVRNDCSIGEPTPLQIAVQDVAKRVEDTKDQVVKRKESS